jgi:hypothetical protein
MGLCGGESLAIIAAYDGGDVIYITLDESWNYVDALLSTAKLILWRSIIGYVSLVTIGETINRSRRGKIIRLR